MNKNIAVIFGLSLGLTLCYPALSLADNYLFPTDIVEEGKVDMDASITQSSYSHSYDINSVGLTGHGTEKFKVLHEEVQLRYGLGDDWHFGIRVPYESFYRREREKSPGSAIGFRETNTDLNGNENLHVWLKHRFIDAEDSPLSLAGALEIAPNTANKHKTQLMASVIAGWKWNETSRGYIGYEREISDQDELADRHSLLAGIYQQVTERITLVPAAGFSHYESASRHSVTTTRSANTYDIGLSAQWQILPNSYVIPGIGYAHIDGYRDGSSLTYGDSNNGKYYTLGIYHVF